MLSDGATGSLSAEEERALQARGLELLNARRSDPNAPQYTPDDAAALRNRGSSLLQAHQQQQQQQQQQPPPHPGATRSSATSSMPGKAALGAQDANLLNPLRTQYDHDASTIAELQRTVTALHETITAQNQELAALRQSTAAATAATGTITVEEAEQAKQVLLAQFSAHMEECNQANQEYWAATQAQHQEELAAMTAAHDLLQTRVSALEAELAQAAAHEAEAVSALQAELSRAAELQQSLTAQCAALTEDATRLQEALARTQTELNDARQALDEASADNHAEEVAMANEQLLALRHELKTRDVATAVMQDEKDKALDEMGAARLHAREVEAEAARQAQAAQAALTSLEEAYQQQLAELQAQLAALEQAHSEQAASAPVVQDVPAPLSTSEDPAPTAAAAPHEDGSGVSNPFRMATADTDGWGDDADAGGVPDRWDAPAPAPDEQQAPPPNPFAAAACPSEPLNAALVSAEAHHLEEGIARLQQALEDERAAHTDALAAAQREVTAMHTSLAHTQAQLEATQAQLEATQAQLAEAATVAQTVAAERDAALAEAAALQQTMEALAARERPPTPRDAPMTVATLTGPSPPASAWADGWDFEEAATTPAAMPAPATPAAPVLGTGSVNPFARGAALPVAQTTETTETTETETEADPFALMPTPGTAAASTEVNPFAVTQTHHSENPFAGGNAFMEAAPETEEEAAPVPTSSAAPEARVAELEAALQAADDERQELQRRVAVLEAGQAALGNAANTAATAAAAASSPVEMLEQSSVSLTGAQAAAHTAAGHHVAESWDDDENAIPTSPSSIAIDDSRRPEPPIVASAVADAAPDLFTKPTPPRAERSCSTETAATALMGLDGEVLQLRERVHTLEAQLAAVDSEALEHTTSSVPTEPSAQIQSQVEDPDLTSGMQVLGRQFADVQRRLTRSQEENATLRDELNHLRQQCGLSPLTVSDPPSQAARMQPPLHTSGAPDGGSVLEELATGQHTGGLSGSFGLATDVSWGPGLGDTLTPLGAAAHHALGDGPAYPSSRDTDSAPPAPADEAPTAPTVTSRRPPVVPLEEEEDDRDVAEDEDVSVSTRAAARRLPAGRLPDEEAGAGEEEGEAVEEDDDDAPRSSDAMDDAANTPQTDSADLATGDDGPEETPTELPRRCTRGRPRSPRASDTTAAAMAELGRQYAEAQHQLMRAVDARTALEADLAEAQQQLAALAEAHEAEMQELADAAEARLTEVEDLCQQRIGELEADLQDAETRAAAAATTSRAGDNIEERAATVNSAQEDHDHEREAAYLAQIAALEHTISELTAQREATEAAHAAALSAARAEVEAVEADKAALEEEMDAMVDQFESQMNERDALLQQRLEEMEAAHHEADADAGGHAARRLAELESALAAGQSAQQRLQERFAQLQAEYEAYVADTHTLRAAHEAQGEANAVHEGNARQLQVLHARLEEMAEHMDAAQRDVNEREAQCTALHAQLAQQAHAHAEALAQVQAQLDDRRREVNELAGHNDELTQLLQDGATSVESALADRERDLKALRAELELHKRREADLGDQLAQREAALEAARGDQSELQRAVADAQASHREAAQQAQAAQQATERQARESAQQAERARLALERLQREHAEELARVSAAHKAELDASHAATDQLRDDLQVAQTMAATLPLEGRRFQAQFDALRQQLESALGENAQLQRTLHDLRAAHVDGSSDASGTAPARSADAHVNALLSRTDELEARCRELTKANNELLKDKDNLTVQALKAERVAEVKEQALRRQEGEVQYCRTQMSSLQNDLGLRVRTNQALQSELESVHEHAAAVAAAYEDLQSSMSGLAHEHAVAAQAEGLMYAKARTIPLLLETYMDAVSAGYSGIAHAVQTDRAQLVGRCDAIEAAAQEAMTEAERQVASYQATLADAQEEQTTLLHTIESLRDNLQVAEQGLAQAVEELKAARVEVRETRRAAHEEVFAAQREQQAVALEHADTLHSLALLQEEVDRAARILQKQKEQYESRLAQLEHDLELTHAKLEAHESQHRAARTATDDDRAQLAGRAEEAERRRDEAVREARGLRAQLERAVPRLAELEEAHAQRSAELMDTAQQLSALSKRTSSEGEVTHRYIHDLSTASQELIAANATLKKANVMNEAALERLKANLGDVQHENEQLRVQRDQQARDLDTITRRANELEVRYAHDVTETQSRQRDLDRHVSGLQERNAHLQEGEQSARQALRETEQKLTAATDALARATESHATTQEQLSRQVQSLRERCAGLETELAALQQLCHTAHAERDARDREYQAALRELDRLKQYLEAANEHNAALNEQMRSGRSEQAAQRADVQQSLEDAQKELHQCRKVLADAEARQLGLESDLYLVQTERDKLQQELQAARAATQKAVEAYKKEQFERHEMASSLQDQVATLYEEVRAGQNKIRGLAAQLEQQRDQNGVLLDEVKEANERCKAQRVECECVKDELATAKEDHRRARWELQAKLEALEDELDSERAAAEQYRQKMTNKIEMYEVTEAALRQEIADLRKDIATLEESLASKARGEATSERDQSRQLLSLHNAEEELRLLRAQTKRDMDDISQLKAQLQQRTTELDRCTRELAAQAAQIRAEMEAQHQVTVDTLTAQCRKTQQALEEARAGRDHAIQSSQLRQKQLEEVEARDAELEEGLRGRQRELELLRHRLQSIELVAAQAAQEAGLPEPSSSSALVDVPKVLDSLLEQVRQYTHGAMSTELESRQHDELRTAVDEHQTLMQRVVQLATQPFHVPLSAGQGTSSAHNTSAVGRRPRTTRSTSFLIEPLSRLDTSADAPALLTDGAAVGANASAMEAPESLVWHPSQQDMVEQLQGASLTLAHRLESHLNTAETALNTLALALSSARADTSSSSSTGSAAAARKVQLTATMQELQRRTSSTNRALERVVEVVSAASRHSQTDLGGGGAGAGGANMSTLSGVSPIRQMPASVANQTAMSHSGEEPYAALTAALVEAVRVFGEAERVVLRPYNEILSTVRPAPATTTTAGTAAAGGGAGAGAAPSPGAAASAYTPATPARTGSPLDTHSWF